MALETRSPMLLRFGTFEVDLRAGELRKQGKRIKLQDQPFQVLGVLLQRPGEVVTREELRKQIWQEDTFVDFDNSLNTAINKLREALGDSAENPRFIETLPRRGYRFLAPVSSNGQKEPVIQHSGRNVGLVLTLVVLVVAAAIGGLLWRLSRARALTEKDSIVLADFKNTTGDPVFDDTLKQGLRVQLGQSPFLSILSDQKVSEQLRLMGRSPDERLSPEVARDLCQRAGSKAILTGAISSLGSHYILGLNALNCQTGDGLASEQAEVDRRELVLKALSNSATNVRKKLGESLASVRKYDVPLEQATTPSLEALKAYSTGFRIWQGKGETAALPFLQKAVELDPKFAMAYARMGVMNGNLFQLDLSQENVRKAYELRENTSARERLYIESQYYGEVTGDLEKAAQAYEAWAQIYPRDFGPHNNLSNTLQNLARYDRGLEEALIAMRLDPAVGDNYITLANSYICLDRLNEAAAVLKQAEEHKLENEGLGVQRYLVAFLKGDEKEMKRLEAASETKPGAEDMFLSQREVVEVYYGRLRKAREIVHVSMNSPKHRDSLTIPALGQASLGLVEAYFGEAQQARADANGAVNQAAPKDFPRWIAALALAIAGDTKEAAKIVEELDRSLPLDTAFQYYFAPSIRAAIAMGNKNPNEAIRQLGATSRYDLGAMGSMDPVYLRGLAYLQLRDGAAAATEFRKVIEHPWIAQTYPPGPGALPQLGLGRAYALRGDIIKARAAYQDFFSLWKDADPDIPVLQQAKSEFAKLN